MIALLDLIERGNDIFCHACLYTSTDSHQLSSDNNWCEEKERINWYDEDEIYNIAKEARVL